MDFGERIADYSIRHYKLVTAIMVLFTLGLGALIPQILVDTDPENMLSEDEPVRVFHNQTKKDFVLSDMVVLGVVNNKDPNGVFNQSSLKKMYELTEFAKTLRVIDGVWDTEVNLIAHFEGLISLKRFKELVSTMSVQSSRHRRVGEKKIAK